MGCCANGDGILLNRKHGRKNAWPGDVLRRRRPPYRRACLCAGILPTAAILHRRQTPSMGRCANGSVRSPEPQTWPGKRVAKRCFAPEMPAAPPCVSPSRNGRIEPGSTGGGVSRLHLPSFAYLAAYRADAHDMEGGAPLCDLTSVCYTLQKQRLAARAGMEMSPQAAFRGRQHSCRLCGHAAKTLDGG